MKVICYAANPGDGSAFYRIQLPAETLAAQGFDVTIGDSKKRLTLGDTSVIVIQRPLNPKVPAVIRDAQSKGIAVVVDIDDAFGHLDPAHAMFYGSAAKEATIQESCKLADLVTVTTPLLLKIYGHGHGVVLENQVPRSMTRILPQGPFDGLKAGWTGTVSSHPRDLQVCGTGIRKAISDNPGSRFHVVGPPAGVSKALGIREMTATGFVPIAEYPQSYANLDVAIVPLDNTIFNSAKSDLKALEACVLGVPFVASPVAETRKLADKGAGLLAADPADWRRKVGQLLCFSNYRVDVAGRGIEVAETRLIENHAYRWWEAWRVALLNRRAMPILV